MALVKYTNWAVDAGGNTIASSDYDVRDTSGTLVQIYSDSSGTTKTNPSTADASGKIEFYVDKGVYDITVGSGLSASTQRVTVGGPDVAFFSSRSEAVSAIAADSAEIEDKFMIFDGTVWYKYSSGATAISDMAGWLPADDVFPEHFQENTTPGTTDMADGINAMIAYAKSDDTVQRMLFKAKYLIGSPIDFSDVGGDRYDIVGGSSIGATEITVAYHGYGADAVSGAAFSFGDPDSPAYQTAFAVSGFYFKRASSSYRSPIGIEGASLAQSRFDDITFGSWSNINFSLNTPQNVRGMDITTFGGGLSFEYKDASAVTVTQSGTTLTATGAIFSASDVGKTVGIWGTGGSDYRRKAVITGYTSATQVTVAKSVTDATARNLYFGSPFASISSGGTTLTADASCFTTDHVGLVIWIKGAGANGGLHRAKITSYTSATQVEIDTAAESTVTTAEFGVPAFEIYSDDAIGNGASDNRFYGLQIENHKGIGVCLYDNDRLHLDGKIHSNQDISSPDLYSISTIWSDRWGGSFYGDWDAQYIGEHRSWFGNQTTSLHIPSLNSRSARDEVIAHIGLRSPTFEGAVVHFGEITTIGDSSTAEVVGDMITDDNSPIAGYALSGTFSRSEYDLNRSFLGNNVSSDRDGALEAASVSFDGGTNVLDSFIDRTSWTPVVADAPSGGNVAGGVFTGQYCKVGPLIVLSFRLTTIDTTGMTAGNPLYIRGLPVAMAAGTNNIVTGSLRVENIATGDKPVTPFGDDGDSALLLYVNNTGAASATLKVSDLTSGTAAIRGSIVYMAN